MLKQNKEFSRLEQLYTSILMNKDKITIGNDKNMKVINEVLGNELISKMTEHEVENRDLKITVQNLVNMLREESQRSVRYANQLTDALKDISRMIKVMDEDYDSEQEVETVDQIIGEQFMHNLDLVLIILIS